MINEDSNILEGGGGFNSDSFQIHPIKKINLNRIKNEDLKKIEGGGTQNLKFFQKVEIIF